MLMNDEVEFVSFDIDYLVGPDNVLSQLQAGGAQVERDLRQRSKMSRVSGPSSTASSGML